GTSSSCRRTQWHPLPRHPHSFPTRRSSDLGHDPANETEPCDEAAPKTELRAQRRRFRALRFEVEQLAALVTDVRDNTEQQSDERDRKSTRLNSSHSQISYAVFCLKKKKQNA